MLSSSSDSSSDSDENAQECLQEVFKAMKDTLSKITVKDASKNTNSASTSRPSLNLKHRKVYDTFNIDDNDSSDEDSVEKKSEPAAPSLGFFIDKGPVGVLTEAPENVETYDFSNFGEINEKEENSDNQESSDDEQLQNDDSSEKKKRRRKRRRKDPNRKKYSFNILFVS